MNITQFFELVRELEQQIETDYTLIKSLKTPDGGKPGVLTEVSRSAAARLIAEKKAALATPEEVQRHDFEQKAKAEGVIPPDAVLDGPVSKG